jgi:hypothetical protein
MIISVYVSEKTLNMIYLQTKKVEITWIEGIRQKGLEPMHHLTARPPYMQTSLAIINKSVSL